MAMRGGYDEDVENDEDMVYPPECVDRLLDEIKKCDGEETPEHEDAEENNSNRNRYRPLPTRQGLRELLDVALAASQQPEEGGFLRFSLAYVGPDGLVPPDVLIPERYDVCPLAEPKPLTTKNIAKLAPAADLRRTYIGVSPRPGTQDLQIWGLIHRRKGHFGSESERGKFTWTPLDLFLMIRVHAPGVLLVNQCSRMHLAYVRGKASWSLPSAVLRDVLRDRARVEPWVAQDICDVVDRMGDLGKVGTLLITAPDLDVSRELLDLTYRFDSPCKILKAAEDDRRKKSHRRDYAPLRAALDFVADLSKVDGVVHLTSDLGIVGFGGKVMRDLPSEAKLTKEDPIKLGVIENASIEGDYRGMRHRSAAQFCANQEGQALAIVVSQDGDVTLVGRRDDGTVHMIGRFDLGIGIAM